MFQSIHSQITKIKNSTCSHEKTHFCCSHVCTCPQIFPQAQQYWVNRYNNNLTNGIDYGRDINVDKNGNVIVTGASLWGGTSSDYYTIKYSLNGSLLWQHRLSNSGDDEAYAVITDDSGNVYVTGGSEGATSQLDFLTIKFTPGGFLSKMQRYEGTGDDVDIAKKVVLSGNGAVYVAGISIGPNGDHDVVLVKYSTGLVQQWVQRFDPGGEEFMTDMTIDNSGNVFITGYTDFNDSKDMFLLKYDSSGTLEWNTYHNGMFSGNDSSTCVAVDSLGNVYMAGYEWGGAPEKGNLIVIMYDTFGNGQWIRTFNGTENGTDYAKDIGVDKYGDIYVTGSGDSTADSDMDYILLKYDVQGIFQWMSKYNGAANGSDEAGALAIDDSANVSITGVSPGTITGNDYATVKFDRNGNELWSKRYNGPVNGDDAAFAIDTYHGSDVFVTGRSISTLNYDFATVRYSPSSPSTLQLTALIEGFYNQSTNQMVADTALVYIRSFTAPYEIIDSTKAVLNSLGSGSFTFSNTDNVTSYYLVLKHRNSIETWSGASVAFTLNQLTYNFTNAASKAYGNNLKLKGSKYCIYSGDSNQDGSVDASDMSVVDNDLYNFATGYLSTDLDGDGNVDASDLSICDNNSYNFVSMVRP
ncbi:MAG: SBBP repeat-containing protein [Ignavibacteria bacterium]|nr:SBBP repeat-containing protein [Ignavibacteria bacterium]